jgi:20S proteasome subunit alpha 6
VYRNQYDTDVTTFSPQGRLFQLEYAMEAVKQGSPTVGLRSNTHAVLVAFKRSPDELASYQEKLFKIDDHMAISISGLTADARFLCKYMRTECLNHNFVYGGTKQTGRLVTQIADMHQRCTQDGGYERRRPFGVGLLVMGYDKTGPHIYQTCPSANFYEYKSQAIGARSQSAKTYLERHFETFDDLSLEELVAHGLKAIEGAAGDKDLDEFNTGVCVVGEGQELKMYSAAEVRAALAAAGIQAGAGAASAPASPTAAGAAAAKDNADEDVDMQEA